MKRAYSKLFGIHTAVGVAIAPPDSLYNCRICAGVLIVGTVGAGTRYIGTAVVINRTRAAAACRCRDKVHTAPRSGSCRAEKTFPPIFRASGLDLPSLHIGIRKLGSSFSGKNSGRAELPTLHGLEIICRSGLEAIDADGGAGGRYIDFRVVGIVGRDIEGR